MGWPPPKPPGTPGTGGYIADGYTTIVWGTTGFSQSGTAFAGLIVVSVRPSQRVEAPVVENGTGLTATQVLLIDGQDFEITLVDDSDADWPVVGDVISMFSPFKGTGINGTPSPATFLVINNNYAGARKQPGERTLLCKAYNLFTP